MSQPYSRKEKPVSILDLDTLKKKKMKQGRERERDRIPSRLCAASMENFEIMT